MSLVRPGPEPVIQKGDKNVNRHPCCNQRAPTSLNYWVGQKVCLGLKKKKGKTQKNFLANLMYFYALS